MRLLKGFLFYIGMSAKRAMYVAVRCVEERALSVSEDDALDRQD